MAAQVTLGLDDTNLRAGLSRATVAVQSFATKSAKAVSGLGGSLSSGLALIGGTAGLRQFAAMGSSIQDMADRFGTSAEAIQRVGNAAKLTGTDIDTIARVMTRLTVEAAKGNAQFESLGISAAAFAGAGLDQQVLMLAKAYENANGDQTKMVELMDLLGSRGQDVMPFIAQGADSMAAAMANVAVIANAAVAALDAMDDNIVQMFAQLMSWAGEAVIQVRLLGAAIAAMKLELEGAGDAVEIFNEAEKEIRAPKEKSKTRTPFDPDAFVGKGGKGGADEAAQKLAERKAIALSELSLDIQIAEAKKKGNDKKAAELEREKKIQSEARRIVEQTGIDAVNARKIAEQLNPEEFGAGGRKKIKGFSGAQRAANKFLDQRGFNQFFHAEETQFGQRSAKALADQSFGEFFHRRDPQRQSKEAREQRKMEKENAKRHQDPIEVLKDMLNETKKLTSY